MLLETMERTTTTTTRRGGNYAHIMDKSKANTIKAPKGKKAETVVAKIRFNDDGKTEGIEYYWDVLISWKQANIRDFHYYSSNLLDIVKMVKDVVYDGLIDLMGRVQEVDVILKMPFKDHKITLSFKEAMKRVS